MKHHFSNQENMMSQLLVELTGLNKRLASLNERLTNQGEQQLKGQSTQEALLTKMLETLET